MLPFIRQIFGWDFQGLGMMIYRHLCESLYAAERMSEGAEYLLKMISIFGKEIRKSKTNTDWVTGEVSRYRIT